mgnify:CR=1 FL=1
MTSSGADTVRPQYGGRRNCDVRLTLNFWIYDLGVTLAEWLPLGGWITGVTNSGLMGWSIRKVKGVIRVGNGKKKKNLSKNRTVNYQHQHNDVIKVGSRKKFDTQNLPTSTFYRSIVCFCSSSGTFDFFNPHNYIVVFNIRIINSNSTLFKKLRSCNFANRKKECQICGKTTKVKSDR